MRKSRLPLMVADLARPALCAAVALALLAALFAFRLGTLTPAASAGEAEFAATAGSISQVIDNPLYLYQKVGNVALGQLDWHSLFTVRALNAALGALAVIAFYLILTRWYTTRVALLATALFASSSWLLFTARSVTPDISYALTLGLILGGIWARQDRNSRAGGIVAGTAAVLLLYVPGAIWFVLAAAIWQRQSLRGAFAALSGPGRMLAAAGLLVSVAPLLWSFSNQPDLIRLWLGLPAQWPGLAEYVRNLLNLPLNLFARGAGDPTTGLGALPLLDSFTSVMVALGLYASARQFRLDRSKLIMAALAGGALFLALDGPASVSFLLPFIYLAAAGGVALMLRRWLTVFPRNPLARGVGIAIMSGVVAMACFYHVNKYFVAWPAAEATRATFQQQI